MDDGSRAKSMTHPTLIHKTFTRGVAWAMQQPISFCGGFAVPYWLYSIKHGFPAMNDIRTSGHQSAILNLRTPKPGPFFPGGGGGGVVVKSYKQNNCYSK